MFLELTCKSKEKALFNVDNIVMIQELLDGTAMVLSNDSDIGVAVKESYKDIKNILHSEIL